MEKIPASVAVITLNEEVNIRACLESSSEFAEVVVVDSGSTDRTCEIAEGLGAKVITHEFSGYGPQKNFAIESCSNDWVLMLDADERLSPECITDVRDVLVLSKGPKAAAYSFRRKGYIADRWIWSCGWWPGKVVRLIDRTRCRVEGAIHERTVVDGDTVSLSGIIDHYSFRDYTDMIERMNTYSSRNAEALMGSGASTNPLMPFAHMAWMFFRSYVLKCGVCQGLDGLAVSLVTAFNSFLKHLKYIEMSRPGKGR